MNSKPLKFLIGSERNDKGSKLLEAIQFAVQSMDILLFLVDSIIVGNHAMMLKCLIYENQIQFFR